MIVPVPDPILPPEELGPVHFVGVGGAGLSGLARLMALRGVRVTGSDAAAAPVLDDLRALGIGCFVGHEASQLGAAQTVVVSTAVPDDNPEVRRALAEGRRVWPRSAAVQSLLLGRSAVVVTGTHGKTTTTAMLVTALVRAGRSPSYAVGAPVPATGRAADLGTDDVFVVEGDESDGAVLVYRPSGLVVTNVDADHLDYFGSREAYAEMFDTLLTRVAAGGFVVCGVDDDGGRRLAATARAAGLHTVTVGRSPDARLRAVDVRPHAGGTDALVVQGPAVLGRLRLQVPGEHYVLDALAAAAAALELGERFSDAAAALLTYPGTSRRMELRGTAGGVRVYDSYAHHPEEIAADVRAARQLAGTGRVVVAFQPHLVSRTREFAREMGRALGGADGVVVLDVYLARERPDPAVTGALVAAAVPLRDGRVTYEPDRRRVVEHLAAAAAPGDLVLTLGAGDVTELAPAVLSALGAHDRPQEETL